MTHDQHLNADRIRYALNSTEFIIAHNAAFDYAFFSALYPEVSYRPWLCSMRQIPWNRYGFRSRGLQTLLQAHRIQTPQAHRASSDCQGLLTLLQYPSPRGYSYFHDLWERHCRMFAPLPVAKGSPV
jgi:DNA polymerase-3 subunit epsilon